MLLILIDDATTGPDLPALARALDDHVEAVLVSDGPSGSDGTAGNGPAPAGVAEALAARGVRRLHRARHEHLTTYAPEAWGAVVAGLIDRLRPRGVLAQAGGRPAEVLTHGAARAGLPLATNCVRIAPFGDTGGTGDGGTGDPGWRVTRTRSGGVLLEDAELVASVPLATVGPSCVVEAGRVPSEPYADTAAVDACELIEHTPDLPAEVARARVVERTARAAGMSLATAPVVVSGGRGVGSSEGFAVLEELATVLGGVVGCSRVATNNGWRSHSDQVGLTGTKIAAELYIACGISGASQHWVGCMDSAVILAINTDPEAPMMQRATYTVVGDVHEVLPAVLAEIRRRADAADTGSGTAAPTPPAGAGASH